MTNTATATGKPPVGANVTDSDTNKVTIAPAAALDVTKTLKSGAPVKAGDPVVWTVSVKNTGNVTLTNVTVTDALEWRDDRHAVWLLFTDCHDRPRRHRSRVTCPIRVTQAEC